MHQVSFVSALGLFCHCIRSLLPLHQVSFATALGLFCLYIRSLLPLDQVSKKGSAPFQESFDKVSFDREVSFASTLGLFSPCIGSLLTVRSHFHPRWVSLTAAQIHLSIFFFLFMYFICILFTCGTDSTSPLGQRQLAGKRKIGVHCLAQYVSVCVYVCMVFTVSHKKKILPPAPRISDD